MEDLRLFGRQFGCEYVEAFRYIGAEPNYVDNIRQYALAHAEPSLIARSQYRGESRGSPTPGRCSPPSMPI